MRKIIILYFTIILTSCGIGAGTHGSIKSYQYPVMKAELEAAVNNVIRNDTVIHREFSGGYYNDTEKYITINIKNIGGANEYIYRYLGDSLNWANSKSSEIFICYIYDGNGNGGSEGNGKWEQTPETIKKNMIDLFESEFINKLDKELKQKHVETQ